MDINQLIDISKEENKSSISAYIQDHMSDEHRKMFARSFYVTLFNNVDKFPINDEDAMKWLGYARKDNFKKNVTKFLTLDVDYTVSEQTTENRGRRAEEFSLTVDAFKKLGMKAGTQQGDNIRMYYIEMEKLLFSYALHQSVRQLKEKDDIIQSTQEQKQLIENENEILRSADQNKNPVLYIFDIYPTTDSTDPTDPKVESLETRTRKKILKIGFTESLVKRSKPFRQVCKEGRMVYSIEVPHTNLRLAENWLHNVLNPYRRTGEVFEMEIDEAKMWIMREVHTLRISSMTDHLEKRRLLAQLSDMEAVIMKGDTQKAATKEIACQTDEIKTEEQINDEKDVLCSRFDDYIAECCIMGENMEVSSTDIAGQYRLWARSADKPTYLALLDYLKVKFRPIRLQVKGEEADRVINGYRGVQLKEVVITRPYNPNDCETFVFHALRFHPSGKILMGDIIKKYEAWGKTVNKVVDQKEIKKYLKECPHVLVSNLWTSNGNGTGYYGICTIDDNIIKKKTSSTAKRIEKRDSNDNIICSWSTIAKAAEAEGICAAKMSRLVKSRSLYNDCYYVHPLM